MIKKRKIFTIVFSVVILLPFSLLSTSCGKTKSVTNSSYSENSDNDSDKMTISEEIKNFIKVKMLPDENTDRSILVIKDLVDQTIDNTTQKEEQVNKIEGFLNQLASKLNKNIEEDEIELKDNKVVEDALKQIIYSKCKTTSDQLKNKFTDQFGELAAEKILDIDDNQLLFKLKSFGIDKILHDIGYNENDTNIKIADSQALKIYKFSTNLEITVNTSSRKKQKLLLII